MDNEVTELLAARNYFLQSETDQARVYTKSIFASATMDTGFAVFTVTMGETKLLVHEDRVDNSYRFGILHGEQGDVSHAFTADEFVQKLAEFESKLNA